MKTIFILFFGAFLWQLATCQFVGELGNDFPTRRKASLFLQNSAIGALDDVIGPEDIVPHAQDFMMTNSDEEDLVDPVLKEKVLVGNYPEKMDVEEHRGNEDESFVNNQFLTSNLIPMDPVEELLLKPVKPHNENHTSTGNDTDEATSIFAEVDEAEAQPKSLKEGLTNFASKLLDCKAKLLFCKRKNIIACYLFCLLNDHPIGRVVQNNVNSLIRILCDPLGTAFDIGLKLYNKQFENVKSLKHYLALLGVVPEAFKRFTRLAANAIPSLILKYSIVEDTELFKPILSSLESDSRAVAGRSIGDITKELSNPGCKALNNFNAVQQIVSVLYKNPKIVDVFLSGMWMLSKVFHLVGAPLVKSTLQAVGGALSILVGVNCGLIHYIKTGSNSTCEGSHHIKWQAEEHELLPPEKGRPEVCGATPHIPVRSILTDLFPPIFDQESLTKPSVPGPEVGGKNITGETDASTKDTSWLDTVLKTLDADEDR